MAYFHKSLSHTRLHPLPLPHHIIPRRERETKLDVYPHSPQATNLVIFKKEINKKATVQETTWRTDILLLYENNYKPALSLMSTSSLSPTVTLKGLFFVSLVSYEAMHWYAFDTKGWVTFPLLKRLFSRSAPPWPVEMLSDWRIITLNVEKRVF